MTTVRMRAGKPLDGERGSDAWAKAAIHHIWLAKAPPNAKLILIGMALMEMRAGAPNLSEIVEYAELPEKEVRRHLAALAAAGWVEHEHPDICWEPTCYWRLR